jgi:hypothetical protein
MAVMAAPISASGVRYPDCPVRAWNVNFPCKIGGGRLYDTSHLAENSIGIRQQSGFGRCVSAQPGPNEITMEFAESPAQVELVIKA